MGLQSLKVWAATVVAKTTAAAEDSVENMVIDELYKVMSKSGVVIQQVARSETRISDLFELPFCAYFVADE